MDLLIIGVLAFLCFFLYDINSVIWQKKILHYSFAFGLALIVFSSAGIILQNISNIQANRIFLIFAIGTAIVSFGALAYTLFFALPFKTTYIDTPERKDVYTGGVYALCRHPGFWGLAGLYLSLTILVPSKPVIIMAFLFNGLNFLYIVFQDRWTFPKTFIDYNQYTDSTPFLIPTLGSIRKCARTIENKKGIHNELKK